jgi:hypothetical protein
MFTEQAEDYLVALLTAQATLEETELTSSSRRTRGISATPGS